MSAENSQYLRFPHLHGDLLTFVAEDDVWVAPLSGGRAWRVSSLGLPAKNPRFSPDGSRLFWTVVQGTAPELVSAAVDGGDFRQHTWFGSLSTKFRGFTPDGSAMVASSFEQPHSSHTFGYAVSPLDGSRRVLPYGPVDTVAYGPVVGDEKPVVLSSVYSREPAWWKRYRGGTAGKLWIDRDGSGEFSRLVPELDGNLVDPMWIGDRIAFLSDHEGYGNLYSVKPNGKKLRRHTDHEGFYVRHAATDGERVVYESAGNLFLLDGLDAEPVQLSITLGSASTGRRKRPLNVSKHLNEVRPDATGRASLLETHGTVHLLTHRDGPSRSIVSVPGVRARLPRLLGADRVIYLADHGGEEALYLKPLLPAAVSKQQVANPTPADPGQSNKDQPSEESGDLPKPVSAISSIDRGAKANSVSQPIADQQAAGVASDVQSAAQAAKASVELTSADDSAEQRFDFPARTRVAALETSPDGRFAAVGTEYGVVYLLNLETAELRELSNSSAANVHEISFSPDSKWLLWSEYTGADSGRSKLRLAAVEAAEQAILDLTDGRFSDFSASFTPDGKFVSFLSRRSFDPVYDTQSFDLAFPSAIKPYLLALAATTPSPFGPSADGTPVVGEPAADDESATDKGKDGAVQLVVDPEGIADRLIAVPVAQGNYDELRSVEGALLWLNRDLEGETGDGRASISDDAGAKRLERFAFDSREVSVLVDDLDSYLLSGDGKRIVVIKAGKVTVVPSDKKAEEKSQDKVSVDLSRVRVQLDPVKVWGQAFDEAWRLQRDFFWTEDLAGLDWTGVYDTYRPIVERLGSYDDLVDLLWEMHGELGTSHAYVRAEATSEPGSAAQGRLGATLSHTPQGWQVQSILPGESSDAQARSPLTAPGSNVRVGDLLLAINGTPIQQSGPEPLLAGTAEKVVELTVVNGEGHPGAVGESRRVAIVPIKDEGRLRYQDWVARNRKLVRQASEGRFGYLHVPDMMAVGWAQLHRDLDSETGLDALIVDVRHNRGGHTSQLVAELIGRKVTAWNRARGVQDTTYPAHAPRGPVVILTDEFAGSDGDIITQVSKLRGIGPVIGTRTWGGVVGIDGRFELADGTGVTQPRYAFWFTGGVGWGVENYGVDPDIEVTFPPHAYGAGEDPQLEYGLGVLSEMLSEIPTDRAPEHAGYRNLKPGSLPPRPQAD
ncbi:S41 family peptidase [Psychromicrobium lacuslunae]|uniref:Tricorn protease homolog n=1 Tax=Psychromicrobium lacuslunae TaxID=1618207 RepID=A0A0D4BXB1_9MICC|nr:S41 family peptidase [Psychromicrobium lacuslunae]AJT40751.1 peptidase S41 [Psychromicrobium lacuslunae]